MAGVYHQLRDSRRRACSLRNRCGCPTDDYCLGVFSRMKNSAITIPTLDADRFRRAAMLGIAPAMPGIDTLSTQEPDRRADVAASADHPIPTLAQARQGARGRKVSTVLGWRRWAVLQS